MQFTAKRPTQIEVATIKMVLPVRYEEEDIPNDFPGRDGDVLTISVNADTGIIKGWPAGREESVHMKVVDGGCYYLYDDKGVEIAALEQEYVPRCIPGEYGDYVIFTIGGDGKIAEWASKFTSDRVGDCFFDRDE